MTVTTVSALTFGQDFTIPNVPGTFTVAGEPMTSDVADDCVRVMLLNPIGRFVMWDAWNGAEVRIP